MRGAQPPRKSWSRGAGTASPRTPKMAKKKRSIRRIGRSSVTYIETISGRSFIGAAMTAQPIARSTLPERRHLEQT